MKLLLTLLLFLSSKVFSWSPCMPFCDSGCTVPKVIGYASSVTSNSSQITQEIIETNRLAAETNKVLINFSESYSNDVSDFATNLAEHLSRRTTSLEGEVDKVIHLFSENPKIISKHLKNVTKGVTESNFAASFHREIGGPISATLLDYLSNRPDSQLIENMLNDSITKLNNLDTLRLPNSKHLNHVKQSEGLKGNYSLEEFESMIVSRVVNIDKLKQFKMAMMRRISLDGESTEFDLIKKLSKSPVISDLSNTNLQNSSKAELIRTTTLVNQLNISLLYRLIELRKVNNASPVQH